MNEPDSNIGPPPPPPPRGEYDVVFVNPAHHGPDYYSPIGINMLATIASDAGYSVHVVDFQRKVIREGFPWPERFIEAAAAELSHVHAAIYAFTVMNVGFPWAAELARIVKRSKPSATVIFGGPHATLLARPILRACPHVDVVATNEGERVIVPLIAAVLSGDRAALEACPNLVLRASDRPRTRLPLLSGATDEFVSTARAAQIEDLDTLPRMRFDADLLAHAGILSVEAGRGCPYHCKFCSSHAIWTRTPRFKSPERLVDEAAAYIRAAPPRLEPLVISYEHDDFLSNRRVFERFAEYKIGRGETFPYTITTRLNHLSDAVIRLLARSGCISVFMGLETGSEALQKSSEKRLRLQTVIPTLWRLIAERIFVSTNFIVGFPDETYDDVVATLELVAKVRWMGCGINISMMCPEPGSAIYDATPPSDYRLLDESAHADELRRGGLDPAALHPVARFHLLTIRNPHYDIVAMNRLVRSMQLLIAEYPLLLNELHAQAGRHMGGVLARVRGWIGDGRTLSHEMVESVAGDVIARAAHPRAREFFAYEYAKAAAKRGRPTTVTRDHFSQDMPNAYYLRLEHVAQAVAS